jgi:hypothetical protein
MQSSDSKIVCARASVLMQTEAVNKSAAISHLNVCVDKEPAVIIIMQHTIGLLILSKDKPKENTASAAHSLSLSLARVISAAARMEV